MKARALRKRLNDTKYIIGDYGDYIGIGTSLSHSLLSINKTTRILKYSLDVFGVGRDAISHAPLLEIWDILTDMLKSGEIDYYLEGKDEIENKIKVYYYDNGEIIESVTDCIGWPNTTIEGMVMYDNTHFESYEEALSNAINREKASIESYERIIKERMQELSEFNVSLLESILRLEKLEDRNGEVRQVLDNKKQHPDNEDE